jgi:hypothetical protein
MNNYINTIFGILRKGIIMDILRNKILGKFKLNSFNIDEAIEKLKEYVLSLKDDRDAAYKELQNYKKEDGLEKIEYKYNKRLNNALLIMSDKEKKLSDEFRDKHYKKCKNGSTYWYKLSGTGIGTSIHIKCDKCGEELDITDVDSW